MLVVFNEGIYSARDVRKGNTFRTHAITGGDMGSLGLMRDERPVFYHASLKRHTARTCFDLSGVESLPTVGHRLFPRGRAAGYPHAAGPHPRRLVVAGAGDGIVSLRWEARMRKLCAQGVPIVRATRVPDGAVFRNAGMSDDDMGTIAADTLSPEKARVLLMLALGRTRNPAEIQQMFLAILTARAAPAHCFRPHGRAAAALCPERMRIAQKRTNRVAFFVRSADSFFFS